MKFSSYVKAIRALYASRNIELELGRPATASALERVERVYGLGLPAELREAFLTSDGLPNEKPFFARPGFLSSYGFASTASALRHRKAMQGRAPKYGAYVQREARDARIAPGWYSPGWLPFADFGGGSLLLMLDSSPTTRGRVGQIIAYTHDPDEISYVAESFEHFLANSLKAAKADPDEFLRLF